MFGHPDYDGHQSLLFAHDAASGLRALIAIHDTTLGPAFGGCRMYPYASEHQAVADVLRLSRGMTYKSAICEQPYGGGKSVIIADPRRDKTPALLHAMGRLVEDLSGRYIVADDVGTTLADLVVMREVTRHTAATTAAAQQPLSATAFACSRPWAPPRKSASAATSWRGCGSRSRGWAMSGCSYVVIWRPQATGDRRR
jgi:leucine dehydrogenase